MIKIVGDVLGDKVSVIRCDALSSHSRDSDGYLDLIYLKRWASYIFKTNYYSDVPKDKISYYTVLDIIKSLEYNKVYFLNTKNETLFYEYFGMCRYFHKESPFRIRNDVFENFLFEFNC